MDGLAFVHGALHWLGCDPTYTVVSFNISNEMFGEIPLPPKIRRNRLTSFIGVSVSGGMLCVHCIKDDDQTFSLWIMKDYDIKESWIKSLTIRNIESSTVIPVYRFTDGEMLFFRATDGSFILSNRIWPLDGDDIVASTIQDGFVYTESLISPKLNH
ncbi:hypothetical protein HAX54_021574 [Datura stramonium]|uniref:F-box associated beta-propeller type 1 domain-containing protein n=1 Tax=Datura stramonium TaxID=4076 RepID=A0ABS8USX2_DATST|nr:hypothetical protein [Datura stramonium]